MSIEKILQDRSGSACELCAATDNLSIYEIPPNTSVSANQAVYICQTCQQQIEDPSKTVASHWRCLNDSMWSEVPAIQVLAWRMLSRLRAEGWPADLLEMLYLDEETLEWAKATGEGTEEEDAVKHVDSNGNILSAGDTVVLIKDLNVKGANFTAKRGTAVRRITLVEDNPEHIEGKVNDQRIVILTKFVKKSS